MYHLTNKQKSSLLNSLRVAAERFEADAKVAGEEVVRVASKAGIHRAANVARVHDQFNAQAREARELYTLFEDAWNVQMEVPTCDGRYTPEPTDAF